MVLSRAIECCTGSALRYARAALSEAQRRRSSRSEKIVTRKGEEENSQAGKEKRVTVKRARCFEYSMYICKTKQRTLRRYMIMRYIEQKNSVIFPPCFKRQVRVRACDAPSSQMCNNPKTTALDNLFDRQPPKRPRRDTREIFFNAAQWRHRLGLQCGLVRGRAGSNSSSSLSSLQ